MTPPDDDRRDPALSRLYHGAQAGEPPAALDTAILAAARAASRPTGRRRPWWQRLQVPVALAATVVLGVMLSLTMERHPPESQEMPATPSAAAPAGTNAERRSTARPAPVESPTPPRAKAEALPRPAPAADATQPAAPPAAPTSVPQATSRAAESPAPAPAQPAAKAMARERPAEELRRMEAVPAAAGAASVLSTPAAWLEEIRQLRRQGHAVEAERRLQEFRQAFPDYPLPEDLR